MTASAAADVRPRNRLSRGHSASYAQQAADFLQSLQPKAVIEAAQERRPLHAGRSRHSWRKCELRRGDFEARGKAKGRCNPRYLSCIKICSELRLIFSTILPAEFRKITPPGNPVNKGRARLRVSVLPHVRVGEVEQVARPRHSDIQDCGLREITGTIRCRAQRDNSFDGSNDKHRTEFVALRAVQRANPYSILVRSNFTGLRITQVISGDAGSVQIGERKCSVVPIATQDTNVARGIMAILEQSSDFRGEETALGLFVQALNDNRSAAFAHAEFGTGIGNRNFSLCDVLSLHSFSTRGKAACRICLVFR